MSCLEIPCAHASQKLTLPEKVGKNKIKCFCTQCGTLIHLRSKQEITANSVEPSGRCVATGGPQTKLNKILHDYVSDF